MSAVSPMSTTEQFLRVAAPDLCKGLYVAELDRPWTDVPLMFQGFEIRDDEELDILRRYCGHVYVDAARSRHDAVRALEPGSDPVSAPDDIDAAARPRPGPRRTDMADVLGRARQPDKDAFRELVAEANAGRGAALDFVEQAMGRLQAGGSLDADSAHDVVGELATIVSRNTTASLWLTSLRERDEYTSRHSVNMCVLMLTFGVHLGLERGELERFAMGALLSDVGMTKTPPEILNKTGPLSADEWEIMKRHPQDGHDIVAAAGHVPRETLEIIQLHHERLDGSGYPFGLQGGQVPLHARLAGLVDTYDAMTSPRVYQDAMPADRVLQYLYNEAGETFGATPVQQFIRCVGVYPVGSLVELDNGAAGVVLGSPPDERVKPTVLLVRTPDGDFHEKRVLLNLAAEAQAGTPTARHVRRVLDPVAEGIDVAGLVAIEFGLGADG